MNTTTKQITTNPEQAADLAALTAAAAAADPVPGAPGATPELQGPDIAKEVAGLVAMAVATLGPLFPSLRDTYTEPVTAAAAQAIAAVCDKHGWMQGGLMGQWGEEIACLAILGPLGFQTYQGIKADLAAREAKEPQRLESVPGAAGGKSVQFGTVAAEAAA